MVQIYLVKKEPILKCLHITRTIANEQYRLMKNREGVKRNICHQS